jgi:putative transcriptional regulator
MELKSKLPALMEQKGIDQKSLAAATGLSPTTVGKLYRNHFDRIDNRTIIALCRFFGLVRLDDLIELVLEPATGDRKSTPAPSTPDTD